MTLEAIIDQYEQGTLAQQSDLELLHALNKITIWHTWRKTHPGDSPRAVPPAEKLNTVATYIEKLTSRRYGCND